MNLLFKATNKELLEIRNKIFLENAVPALKKNGFEKSPFLTAWYGKNNLGDYSYELCRLSACSYIEIITTHIIKGERWMQIYLNIFHITPDIKSLEELTGFDGLQPGLPPNSLTKMRLWIDDFKGMQLFNLNFSRHKIEPYYSKNGLQKKREKLSNIISKDMNNIDSFIEKWHKKYKPLTINRNSDNKKQIKYLRNH